MSVGTVVYVMAAVIAVQFLVLYLLFGAWRSSLAELRASREAWSMLLRRLESFDSSLLREFSDVNDDE